MSLKFWNYDHNSQKYELNTRIDSPHKSQVSALIFQPSNSGQTTVVSLGFDRRFKMWKLVENKQYNSISEKKKQKEADEPKTTSSWSCHAVGFYRDYKPHDAAFSYDGSILAIAYGQVITFFFFLFLNKKI